MILKPKTVQLDFVAEVTFVVVVVVAVYTKAIVLSTATESRLICVTHCRLILLPAVTLANILYLCCSLPYIYKAIACAIFHQLMRLGPKFLVMNSLVYYTYTHSVRPTPKNLSLFYFRLFSSFVI